MNKSPGVHFHISETLQSLLGLLYLHKAQAAGEAERRAFARAEALVKLVSAVRRLDLAEPPLAFADYLDAACAGAAECVETPARAQLLTQIDAIEVDPRLTRLLGLVACELVGNALRHAFPGRDDGQVQVACGHDAEGALRLEVEDDGVGLPEGADLARLEGGGLRVLSLLLEQVGGRLSFARGRPGCRFFVTVPPADGRAGPRER